MRLVDLLERYDVELTFDGGGRYKAVCPFHEEKTPSFKVFPDDSFYCFGCGKNGTVYDFVMLKHNLSFKQAKELLDGSTSITFAQVQEKIKRLSETQPKNVVRRLRVNRLTRLLFKFNLDWIGLKVIRYEDAIPDAILDKLEVWLSSKMENDSVNSKVV